MAGYNPPMFKDFDNGAQVVSIANELVAASLMGFTVGSRNDPSGFIGMAHIVEHELCRGASLQAIQTVLRGNTKLAEHLRRPVPVSDRHTNRTYRKFFGGSNGPGINIFTMAGHTGYGHQDLFHPRYLRDVFPVIAGNVRDGMYDMRTMRNRDDVIISPQSFNVERSAVGNETAENDEWAAMQGYRDALKALYATNPARHFGDSDPVQLARVKLGTVKQWAQGHYVPANMRVIIIGPSKNAAVRLARKIGLDKIPAWTPASWQYDRSDDVPVLSGVKHLEIVRQGTKMRHVCMLWPTEPYGCRDALALEVLVGVLKDRIEDELRENNTEHPGGVYHPFVDWDCSSSHGFFTVQFSTQGNDAHCDGLVRRVLDVIEAVKADRSDLIEEDVSDSRFYLAKAYREEYQFTPGAFADRILNALANGDDKLEKFVAYYNNVFRVSTTRVRNAASRYLHRDRFVLSVVRPAE